MEALARRFTCQAKKEKESVADMVMSLADQTFSGQPKNSRTFPLTFGCSPLSLFFF